MKFKNTKEGYGLIAKIFHWPMALIMLGLIVVGFYMGGLENSPQKFEIYALHKSFGILILWLVGLRLLWRLFTKQPQSHDNHALWERALAKIAHIFLYGAMIGMPLSGWLMSSAGEYPVPFFGLQMPALVGKDIDLAQLMHQTHAYLAYALIGAIALHALGALKHHFVDGDNTLTRMMANPMREFGPYLIIVILGMFGFGVLKFAVLENLKSNVTTEQVSEAEQKENSSNGGQWKILPDVSRINFTSSVYGKEFTGTFPRFDGIIDFDPHNLASAKADITIYIKDMSSGDAERDAEMLSQEWFDISSYTTARFKTLNFEEAGAGNYVAVGELTIKNRSMPVTLPFKLDIVDNSPEKGRRSYMHGQLSLNRLDFGLGQGRWETTDIVGLSTTLDIKLVAKSP